MQRTLLMKPVGDTYYVVSPPLGLGYLASALRSAGHEVDIVDAGQARLTYAAFVRRITDRAYDVIGFQVFTHEMPSVRRHIELVRKYSPHSTVIVGGAQPSGDPRGTLEYLDADYAFVGEAERSLPQFMRIPADERSSTTVLQTIPGLARRSGGEIVINPSARESDLDHLEFPAWDAIDPRTYPTAPHGTFIKRWPCAPIIITRGCPYRCTFCAGFTVTGRRLRWRSVENVMREVELLYRVYGVRELHIEDDNFTLRKDLVIEFCTQLIQRGIHVSWACPNGVRLDTLDREMLEVMERSGCYSFAVGIESGSERILRSMRKSLTLEQVREKIALIKRTTRISITGFFLLGDPHETEDDVLATLRFARELPIDKAGFAFMMPLPGTPVWDAWRSTQGSAKYEDFFYYRTTGLSAIPPRRLRQLYRRAVLTFYLRPRILYGLLKELRSPRQIWVIFMRVMNIFFKNNG